MSGDDDLVVSMGSGVIRSPKFPAVVIIMAFANGPERIYVFTAPKAYETIDILDAAIKVRGHVDPPEVMAAATKLFQEHKPEMEAIDVGKLNLSHVTLKDIYWDERAHSMNVATVCVDGSTSRFVLGNFAMWMLLSLLSGGIREGRFKRPHQTVTN